jgi:subtilisin family serine protease
VAVGAVDDRDARLSYSSCGPNSERPKPDFVAEVPFPSLWRSRPFSGTSAAAPQAAGLTALLWSRRPEWTAAKVRDALKNAAVDLGPKGHDCETGYGRVHLP